MPWVVIGRLCHLTARDEDLRLRGEARAVADRGIVDGVLGDRVVRVRPEALRAERTALADPGQEVGNPADRGAGGVWPAVAGGGKAEGDGHQRQLAIADAEVGLEDLRHHRRQGGPVGDPPAGPDRVADRMDGADAGPGLLADAGVVGGQQHPAARLEFEPSATAIGSHAPTVRTVPSAIASASGLGSFGSDSSERASARRRRLRRSAGREPASARVEDRQLRQDALVADVALPPDRLVGDRIGVRLRAGPGGRRSRSPAGRPDRFIVVAE
jgi:hypothetical protein